MKTIVGWGTLRRFRNVGAPTDADLLERYIATRDDSAFAEIVDRHGPKVFAVCRRVLGHHHLAEDAFQATFVVLAKKADSIRPRSAVGGFLYGVARRAALEAYAVSRRRKETLVANPPETPTPEQPGVEPDVLARLDAAIADLSEPLRAAVVLCELDGLSRTEAALQLGIAEGTLSSRLAAARKQLARALAVHGVVYSAGLLAMLATAATAAVPPASLAASATATQIAHGVLRTMLLSQLKIASALVALVAMVSGIGLWPFAPAVEPEPAPAPQVAKTEHPDGLIWLHDRGGQRLLAYSPTGELVDRLPLPKTQTFLGLTPDGKRIVYANTNDQKPTYHLRDFGLDTPGTDLGLEYSPVDLQPIWNLAGTAFIRQRGEDPKKMVGVRSTIMTYDLCNVATRRVTHLECEPEHWLLGWAPDQKRYVAMAVGITGVGVRVRNGDLFFSDGKNDLEWIRRVGDLVMSNTIASATDGRTLLLGGVLKTPPKQPWHHALWSLDTVTGKVTELVHELGQGYTEGHWSPDGQRLCLLWGFTKDPTASDGWDEQRLTIAAADGTKRKTITVRDKAKNEEIYDIALLGWYPPTRAAIDPNADRKFVVIPLTSIAADEAARIITEVFNGPAGNQKTKAVRKDRVRVVAEKASNSLIVLEASSIDLATIRKLLEKICDPGTRVVVRGRLGLIAKPDGKPGPVSATIIAGGSELPIIGDDTTNAERDLVQLAAKYIRPGSTTIIMPHLEIKGMLSFRPSKIVNDATGTTIDGPGSWAVLAESVVVLPDELEGNGTIDVTTNGQLGGSYHRNEAKKQPLELTIKMERGELPLEYRENERVAETVGLIFSKRMAIAGSTVTGLSTPWVQVKGRLESRVSEASVSNGAKQEISRVWVLVATDVKHLDITPRK